MWSTHHEGLPRGLRRSRNYARLVVWVRVFVVSCTVGAVAFVVAGPLGLEPLSWSLIVFGVCLVSWIVGMVAGVAMSFALAHLTDEYDGLAIGLPGRRALMRLVARDLFMGVSSAASG
jgi:hypothetical protein